MAPPDNAAHTTAGTTALISGNRRRRARDAGRRAAFDGSCLIRRGQVMQFELEAKTVIAERAESFWQVGFADDPVDTTEYLLLRRDVEDDEQNIRLGMATYYVEVGGQGASCYGGISTFDLQPGQLTITFAPEGAARVGCDKARITFDLSPDEQHNLKDVLRRVFAGSDARTTGLG